MSDFQLSSLLKQNLNFSYNFVDYGLPTYALGSLRINDRKITLSEKAAIQKMILKKQIKIHVQSMYSMDM